MKNTYLGLFFTTLATLMFEILLTRIFSVATWYYFAFFAISVAMFGFTVGALIVYLYEKYFEDEKLSERLCLFALLFAVAIDIALVLFLAIPFYPRFTGVGVFSTVFQYMVVATPFVFSGVVVCLCLTRFPGRVGLLYGADMIGAAIGAFMVFPVLNAMDAPTAIFLTGAVAAIGAIFFAKSSASSILYRRSAIVFLILTVFMMANFFYRPVRVEWVKKAYNEPEEEVWNTLSRIAVYPLEWVEEPYSWGLSTTYRAKKLIGQRMLDIDGVSETPLVYYDGTIESIEHIRYDVTSIVHYLRDDARVFVIGVGGGRDILAASRLFNQKRIVGAEINDRILEMVNVRYGDFTGHIDKLPGVTLISDEARSAITRMDEKFDIIQASCIATWSATSAGAFSLAENSLYTVEAWKIFFDHLSPDGILSFNRWYSPDYPAQLLRLTSLAARTLKDMGVAEPGRHIAVVRSAFIGREVPGGFMLGRMPSATILVGKSPFSDKDMARLRSVVEELEFTIVYDPLEEIKEDARFAAVIDNVDNPAFYASTALDISPPTDDRPFFFYMLRLNDLFKGKHLEFQEQRFNLIGMTMLYVLLGVSVVLCLVFIIGPLIVHRSKVPLPRGRALVGMLFFASLGFGYIFVEISQLQRLIIFLGHPIYSITVVLFTMLLASGIGALVSNRWMKGRGPQPHHVLIPMTLLLVLILVVLYLQPPVLSWFVTSRIAARIGVSLLFLAPLGFLMGMPFPLGMELASAISKEHTPWFWAINGATGVVASVLSVCISISLGFSATLTAGLIAYLVASFALMVLYKVWSGLKAGGE